jgi:murein DD-endopeptidase MepM/ murein hydrolase activator NlpD
MGKLYILGVLLLLTSLIVDVKSVSAQAVFDETFYKNNDILFYDPRATPCNASSSSTTDTSALSVNENDNAKAILTFLTTKGMTLAAAAGFAGNMKQESGLNPSIIQGGKTASNDYKPVNGIGFGLVQWTFGGTTGGRQGGLYKLSQSQNKPITDINLQLEYVWKELTSTYKTSTLDKVQSIGDPVEAAIIVHDNYEVSADSDAAVKKVRGGNAQKYYDNFKNEIDDGTPVTAIDAPATQTESGCQDTSISGGVGISEDGFVFPLKTTQTVIKNGEPVSKAKWCYTNTKNCHHTANAADISAPEGTIVLAVRGGTVVSANPSNGNCASSSLGCNLTFKGDDGVLYYYAHMKERDPSIKPGGKLAAGQAVARVGTKAMAINTHPHLHINALPGDKYSSQPGCLKGNCPNASDYIDIQPVLVNAFQKLPE